MKIKIETTIDLSDEDIAAIKFYMDDLGIEGETLRDFVKSSCAAYAQGFVNQTESNYREHVQ
tara:strand:- start:35 stop:220 length:186 start_codon:yes stop_codon:yes gene_type:complete